MTLTKQLLFLFCILASISFTASATNYNEADSKEFLLASALTYCSPKSIQSWTCGIACQNLTGYKVFFTQQFVVTKLETLAFSMLSHPTTKRFVVAFRGTVGGVELLLEVLQRGAVDYKLANIPGALADNYFYQHYVDVLRDTFFAQLKQAYGNYSDYQFVFTGHSLGAAFTTLAAFDAITQGIIPKEKVIVYNYGMPRLGNYILAKAIEGSIKSIYRVVHWKDIVPHVPFCQQSSGQCVNASSAANALPGAWPAWHVTQEIWYNETNSGYVACGGDGEDPNCSDSVSLAQGSVINHLYYFGVFMECLKTTAISVPENYEQNMKRVSEFSSSKKGGMRGPRIEDLLARIELSF